MRPPLHPTDRQAASDALSPSETQVSGANQPPFTGDLTGKKSKSGKNPGLGWLLALLLLVIGFETFIILEQRRVSQQLEAQAQAAYGRFLKQGRLASTQTGADIVLRNTHYCWSREVCIDTDRLTATAVPLTGDKVVTFDNLNSFIVQVHNANVRISPQTLQGMFNESVFNYPGSNLRNLTVNIRKVGTENRVDLSGSLKYFLWIPFQMETNLSVNQASNTLVISVYKLRVFGFIPATWLLDLKPFNLQKLLTLPPNRYLTVRENLMMVKPFGLFPPPRINGKMAAITVMPKMIQLSFRGKEPAMAARAGNSAITLQGGNAQFGNIRLLGAEVTVQDAQPDNVFRFSLLNYLSYLPQSRVKLHADGSVAVTMPDNRTIPAMAQSLSRPSNDSRLERKRGVDEKATVNAGGQPKEPSLWERASRKVKAWLRI